MFISGTKPKLIVPDFVLTEGLNCEITVNFKPSKD